MTQEKKSVIIQSKSLNCQKMIRRSSEVENRLKQSSKSDLSAIMCYALMINFQAFSRSILYFLKRQHDLTVQQKSKYEDLTSGIIQIDSQPEKGTENKIIQKQSVVESNKRKNVIQKQIQIQLKNPIRCSQKVSKKHQKQQQKIKLIKKVKKQSFIRKVSQQSFVKPNKLKPKEKQIQIDLVDWINIKYDIMKENQIAEKKQNLIKRAVIDWNHLDKNRSERRELRMLKN